MPERCADGEVGRERLHYINKEKKTERESQGAAGKKILIIRQM